MMRQAARRTSGSRDGVNTAATAIASAGTAMAVSARFVHGTTKPGAPLVERTVKATNVPSATPNPQPTPAITSAWLAASARRRRGAAPTAASVARSARPSAAESAIEIAAPASVMNAAAMIAISSGVFFGLLGPALDQRRGAERGRRLERAVLLGAGRARGVGDVGAGVDDRPPVPTATEAGIRPMGRSP